MDLPFLWGVIKFSGGMAGISPSTTLNNMVTLMDFLLYSSFGISNFLWILVMVCMFTLADNKKKMKDKGMVVTEIPYSKGRKILHLDGGRYSQDRKDTIKKCFHLLEEKKFSSITSIAFPVIGCGAYTMVL